MHGTAGETLGYLPLCEFAITHTVTAGTLIGFPLACLQLQLPQRAFLVPTILNALERIDQAASLPVAPAGDLSHFSPDYSPRFGLPPSRLLRSRS